MSGGPDMKNELGVSSVVGVVLLLLLVVLAASVIGITLSTATQNAAESTPNVIFAPSANPHMLYHSGGDILYKNRLVFYVNGVDITGLTIINDDDKWTEWRTGQAIELPSGYSVSNLTIIALDNLGRKQLLYRGSGVVVTPVPTPITPTPTVTPTTPTPTPTPTPSHLPDASFTWEVDFGSEVPQSSLPSWLTADAYVITDEGRVWYWFPPHWEWYRYADVEFTAVETSADVTYDWSSTGADISNPYDRVTEMRFNDPELYSVTLTVTNSSGSNSSTKTFSVRNPGITAMMWIKHDGWQAKSGNYYYYPSFEAYNYYRSFLFWNYKWEFIVESSTNLRNNNDNYDLEFNLGSSPGSVQRNYLILNANTWYHVTGTFEEDTSSNLNIFVDGSVSGTSTTSSSLAYTEEGEVYVDDTNHFEYDDSMFYEIPFALTAAEISAVYNAEKDLPKS